VTVDPKPTLEELAKMAIEGNRDAVDWLVRALQRDVYGLALRMLWNREDAEDATQEILVRVVTRLSQFDFRSRLTTWVFRVAVNHILDTKKSPVEQLNLTFDRFGDDLAQGLSCDGPAESERSILVEEVKIGCTLGMLQCLDRAHRATYILGEILELPAPEAARALAVTPGAFRKRLQRARERIESFTRKHCGLVSDDVACRCPRRVPAAIRLGRIQLGDPRFADAPISFKETRDLVRRVDEARQALAVHRSNHPRRSAVDFALRIATAIERRGHVRR
jgi:RNA polymerase sigma factor (sigma-70 family)